MINFFFVRCRRLSSLILVVDIVDVSAIIDNGHAGMKNDVVLEEALKR